MHISLSRRLEVFIELVMVRIPTPETGVPTPSPSRKTEACWKFVETRSTNNKQRAHNPYIDKNLAGFWLDQPLIQDSMLSIVVLTSALVAPQPRVDALLALRGGGSATLPQVVLTAAGSAVSLSGMASMVECVRLLCQPSPAHSRGSMDPHLHPPRARVIVQSLVGIQGVRQGGPPTHGEAQVWARQQGQALGIRWGESAFTAWWRGAFRLGRDQTLGRTRILHHDAWSWT